MIAPFGDVRFKAYLLAEILTDCIIPIEDCFKILFKIKDNNWYNNSLNASQVSQGKTFGVEEG